MREARADGSQKGVYVEDVLLEPLHAVAAKT